VSVVVIHSQPDQDADRIDEVLEFWRNENPDLDVTTKGLSMRLRRSCRLLERAMRQELATMDVEMWEMEMLFSLRRAPGLQRSAGALLRETGVTSGAITNRLSRLEEHGWVRRDTDLTDRRQVLVTLTDAGRARANELIAVKTNAEARLYSGVPRETLERLGADLRALLTSIDQDLPGEY
jgi:DNA-binding MarR family transcriptional regulator